MVIVRVRGIGVAVMTSKSGAGSRAVSLARCATPNLCCSSITASPRFENEIDSYSKACVPTMIWGWSVARRRLGSARCPRAGSRHPASELLYVTSWYKPKINLHPASPPLHPMDFEDIK